MRNLRIRSASGQLADYLKEEIRAGESGIGDRPLEVAGAYGIRQSRTA